MQKRKKRDVAVRIAKLVLLTKVPVPLSRKHKSLYAKGHPSVAMRVLDHGFEWASRTNGLRAVRPAILVAVGRREGSRAVRPGIYKTEVRTKICRPGAYFSCGGGSTNMAALRASVTSLTG